MDFNPTVEEVEVDLGKKEWRVRWGGGYPAILLGEPGWQSDLPGKKVLIQATDLLEHQDMVILGEHSCGIQDFLDWCCGMLENAPWVFLHGGTWMPSLSKVSKQAESMRVRAFETLEKVSTQKSADRKADALIEWASELSTDVHLIIRDFAALGPDGSLELARAFRLIRDNHECPRLRILVGSSSESYLTDDLFSSFLPMTYRYRMSPLEEKGIRLLVTKALGEDVSVESEVLQKVEELVGGQPFLTHRIIRRLAELLQGRKKIHVRDLEEAFRLEKRSPPPVAQSWQRDLATILSGHPELLGPMRAYVAGATLGLGSMPPNDAERPLFVAGWLRTQRDGRWGIASELHAALARPILDRAGRGLKAEGSAR